MVHRREKAIDSTGLFIDSSLLPDCDIFHYEQYDKDTYFVHLMQSLDQTRFPNATYPLHPILIEDTDGQWSLAYDFRYLKNIHGHMNNPALGSRIRAKHAAAWNLIRRRHKPLLDTLESNDFEPRAICDFDWSEAIKRIDEDGTHGP
jgi:hypothetical protein